MKLPILALAILIATPAFADPISTATHPISNADAAPQPQMVNSEDANALISAVRQQRDANADQLAQAMAQIAKLQKALDATKVKPEVKK